MKWNCKVFCAMASVLEAEIWCGAHSEKLKKTYFIKWAWFN
jgi:hypothetical protein